MAGLTVSRHPFVSRFQPETKDTGKKDVCGAYAPHTSFFPDTSCRDDEQVRTIYSASIGFEVAPVIMHMAFLQARPSLSVMPSD